MRRLIIIITLICLFMFSLNVRKVGALVEEVSEIPVNHTLHKKEVTLVNEETILTTSIASFTTEDYNPTSKKWNGMPSVITSGKNIFVAWQTGGVKEPDPDSLNYINIAASSDGGLSWKNPYMIIDPTEESVEVRVPQFYYNNAGVLQLLYYRTDKGMCRMELYHTNGALEDVRYSNSSPINVNNSSFTKPTVLANGTIMYASAAKTTIFTSTDDGASFKKTASIESSSPSDALRFGESTIVEKKDGTLWCLRRLENAIDGGIEQSYSKDGGITWSIASGNLPDPLKSPGSRFTMMRLSSGNLIFITNAAGMGNTNRSKMTAYLSTDDGESWPYELLLDNVMSSYPDVWQDENGLIYAVFDKDRYGEGGMRLCTFTEADLKAGKYESANAHQLLVITKMDNSYADITTIIGNFGYKEPFDCNMDSKEIVASFPTTIKVIDENGTIHELEGSYRISGYKKGEAGKYTVYFTPKNLQTNLKNSFDIFHFEIETIIDEPSDGAGCALSIRSSLVLFVALIPTTFMLIRKRRDN